MNSHNDTDLLLSVLACNLNIIMIKDRKVTLRKLLPPQKIKHTINSQDLNSLTSSIDRAVGTFAVHQLSNKSAIRA